MSFRASAQRFALPALGRAAGRRPTGKMLRRRKMLGIAPESPASGARFVSLRFVAPDALAIKDLPANLTISYNEFGFLPKRKSDYETECKFCKTKLILSRFSVNPLKSDFTHFTNTDIELP